MSADPADVEQANPPRPCGPNSLDHREQVAGQRALSAQVSVDAAQIGQVFDHLGGRVIAPSINSASRLRSAKEANIL